MEKWGALLWAGNPYSGKRLGSCPQLHLNNSLICSFKKAWNLLTLGDTHKLLKTRQKTKLALSQNCSKSMPGCWTLLQKQRKEDRSLGKGNRWPEASIREGLKRLLAWESGHYYLESQNKGIYNWSAKIAERNGWDGRELAHRIWVFRISRHAFKSQEMLRGKVFRGSCGPFLPISFQTWWTKNPMTDQKIN